jgi:hypothetical protein
VDLQKSHAFAFSVLHLADVSAPRLGNAQRDDEVLETLAGH